MKSLLEILDYNVHYISSDIRHPSNHILILLTDLKVPGDKQLVDVGLGVPTLTSIPLDFENESPIYKQLFVEYKFVYEGEKLVRYHKKKSAMLLPPMKEGEEEKEWREYVNIDLFPRELGFFDETMNKAYGDPNSMITRFHSCLRVVVLGEDSVAKFIIKDTSLLLENELLEEKLESVEKLLENVKQNIPVLGSETEKALENLDFFKDGETILAIHS